MKKIFVGYDSREVPAYSACIKSIKDNFKQKHNL
jgi:hypothetical protein